MEPRLYSVAPDGTTAPPSEPPGPPRERGSKTPAKARPNLPVPTDRMNFETQTEALQTICAASRGRQEPVSAEKMATFMQVSSMTAPLNNKFFAYLGLIEPAGKGLYKPKPLAMKYQQMVSFDSTSKEAPTLLAPAFEKSWFYEAVKDMLALRPEVTIDQMVATLAMCAGTDATYSKQCRFCLEWLRYVGLITLDGNMVRLAPKVTDVAAEPEPDRAEDASVPAEPEPEQEVVWPEEYARPQAVLPPVKVEPTVIALSFNIALTGADLARLTPEQIASFMDGFTRVVATKAVLTTT